MLEVTEGCQNKMLRLAQIAYSYIGVSCWQAGTLMKCGAFVVDIAAFGLMQAW